MSLPAFLSPAHEPLADALGDAIPALSPEVVQVCSDLWNEARSAWSRRPRENSHREDVAIHATFALLREVTAALAAHPQPALRAYINEALRQVLREERATVEDERSFALRQLEQALDHYAVATETLMSAGGVDDALAELLSRADKAESALPPVFRALCRANGALLMAFEAMQSDNAEELRFWARQAVERWRGVVADLPALADLPRGARIQTSARGAWDHWTDDDRAIERGAWKALG